MTLEELKIIITHKDFKISNGSHWLFNETTLLIYKKPVTQYNINEKDKIFYLHLVNPVDINEDYIIIIDKISPRLSIILKPKNQIERTLILEEVFPHS